MNPVTTRQNLFRLFLLCFVYSILSFTAPLYVECQDIFPDEWLDIFGMLSTPSISAPLRTTIRLFHAVLVSFKLTPKDHGLQCHDPGGFCWLLLIFDLVSSVTLRC